MSEVSERPIPNASEATAFLLRLHDGDVYLFTTEGGMRAQKCSRGSPARIGMEVATAATLRHDVYYHPARTNEKWPGRTTPTKDQVDDSTWVWCEIDPRAKEPFEAERQRIASLPWPDGVPPATITVFSGGGRQFLWRLSKPVA